MFLNANGGDRFCVLQMPLAIARAKLELADYYSPIGLYL